MKGKLKQNKAIVCIVGLGYVGLPLAKAFSEHFKVIGYDVNEKKVKELNDNEENIEFTTDPPLIKQADFVIIAVPTPVMTVKALNDVEKVIKNSKVLIMGLTYNTRESSVREMVKELEEFGMKIFGYDPLLGKEDMEEFGVEALDRLSVKVDAVIITVAHDEIKKMDLVDIKKFMNDKSVLIDVRGMFDVKMAEKEGFVYRRL